MFGDINALPGAEPQFPAADRNLQRHAIEHGFDMRRHIVRPFHFVDITGLRRRQPIERSDQILAHIGVGIFLNHQRCRGVFEIEQQRAVARLDVFEKRSRITADFKETFARRLDGQNRLSRLSRRA